MRQQVQFPAREPDLALVPLPRSPVQRILPTLAFGFRVSAAWGMGVGLLLPLEAGWALSKPLNPELKIGIVQRFGAGPSDRLTIEATPGDRLTLKFPSRDRWETFTTEKLAVEIQPQPLASPLVEERVVLSSHRSFESAETRGQQWQSQGIAVEVAQPSNWQVWAKRDRYHNPLNRLLLLETLRLQGEKHVYLDRKVWQHKPQMSWVINGFRYNRDHLEITTAQNLVRVNNKLYGGSLRLQPNAYRSYTLVNQVPVETYLRGVVPHEIGVGAPETTIQAQTIIARTYALRNLRRFRIDNYELCADTQCQVYEGLNGTDPGVDRAIASTAGQVLTYNNELVDALYSSTTGGVTAPFEDVWEGQSRPYLKAIVDAFPNQIWDLANRNLSNEANFRAFIGLREGFNEASWRQFRWRYESSLIQLSQSFRKFLERQQHPLANFKTLQQLQITGRSPAGRVQQLQVTTDAGTLTLAKDEILRGFEAPGSLLFYLDPLYTSDGKTLRGYAFVGGGLGHGVGLSQTGSYRLGRLGWSAAQILKFYYPGTQLQPLSQSIVFWRDPNSPAAVVEVPPPPTAGFNLLQLEIGGFKLADLLNRLP